MRKLLKPQNRRLRNRREGKGIIITMRKQQRTTAHIAHGELSFKIEIFIYLQRLVQSRKLNAS